MSKFVSNQESYTNSVMKQKAMIYFGKDGPAKDLVERFEEGTNLLFYENPQDIYAYMSLFFKKFMKNPVICKLQTKMLLKPCGAPGFDVELFCNYNNDVKSVGTYTSTYNYNCLSSMVQVVYDSQEAIRIINDLSSALNNVCPFDQVYIDKFLCEYYGKLVQTWEGETRAMEEGERMKRALEGVVEEEDTPKLKSQNSKKKTSQKSKTESTHSADDSSGDHATVSPAKEMAGLQGKGAISELVCTSAAHLLDIPLYQHISNLFLISETSHYSLPVTMVTLFDSTSSHVRFIKEYLLIPSPTTHMNTFIGVLHRLMPALAQEGSRPDLRSKSNNSNKATKEKKATAGASSLNEIETVINLIKEALLQVGCELNRDFYLGLTCSPLDCFQQETDTYELNPGETRTAREVREMLVDLQARYPYIICYIDPLHMKSRDEWTKLCSQVSSQCYVIVSEVFENAAWKLLEERVDESFISSGIMLHHHSSNSLSDLWNCAFKYKGSHPLTLLSTTDTDSCSTFIVDLAVAMRALFLKLGNIGRVEKTAKFNRLLQIYNELTSKDLVCQDFFQFAQVGPVYHEEEKDLGDEGSEEEFSNVSLKKTNKKKKNE